MAVKKQNSKKAGRTAKEDVLLDVKNLRVEFKMKNGVVRAVDDISYQVRKGEFLAVVGESGCGKSVSALSLMRVLQEKAA